MLLVKWHYFECVCWRLFHRGWIERPRLSLNVGSSILWFWAPDWMKNKKATHLCFPLSASWSAQMWASSLLWPRTSRPIPATMDCDLWTQTNFHSLKFHLFQHWVIVIRGVTNTPSPPFPFLLAFFFPIFSSIFYFILLFYSPFSLFPLSFFFSHLFMQDGMKSR